MEIKFCKDCAFARPRIREEYVPGGFLSAGRTKKVETWEYAKCARTDLVGGCADGQNGSYCSSERESYTHKDLCGPSAKYFQPRGSCCCAKAEGK